MADSTNRPSVVAFDVNETLFSLEEVYTRMRAAGLPADAPSTWLTSVLRDGFALAAAGDYRPFAEIAAGNLRGLLGGQAQGNDSTDSTDEAVGQILDGFRESGVHPDVAPAMHRLRSAGVRIVTLTNGDAKITEHNLSRHGLRDHVEQCLSVDDVSAWKPLAQPYRYAADVCKVPTHRMTLVAVHSWDCHGAQRAGLHSGYARRLEGGHNPMFGAPDVEGQDLVEVIDGLLCLPPA